MIELTPEEFAALPEYSCSVPTGFTLGKRWKRHEPYRYTDPAELTWWLGEYVEDAHGGRHISWKEIVVLTPREAQVREALAR